VFLLPALTGTSGPIVSVKYPWSLRRFSGGGSDYLPLRCCCVTGGGVPAVAGSPRHDANVCGRPLALGQVLEHTERR
jgi:hypothetical protein